MTDEHFSGNAAERRAALQSVWDVEPMDVPEPDQLHDELDAIRGRRLA